MFGVVFLYYIETLILCNFKELKKAFWLRDNVNLKKMSFATFMS